MRGFIRVSSKSQRHNQAKAASEYPQASRRTALVLGADAEACNAASEALETRGLATLRLWRVADLRSAMFEDAGLLLCEDVLPDGDFRDILKLSLSQEAAVPVIVFSRLADWDQYLAAVRLGAHDLLRFPFRTGELQWVAERALAEGSLGLPDGAAGEFLR